jgi:hypothetical protein
MPPIDRPMLIHTRKATGVFLCICHLGRRGPMDTVHVKLSIRCPLSNTKLLYGGGGSKKLKNISLQISSLTLTN